MANLVEKNTNRCICLARVSTDKQSYDEQVKSLIDAAMKDGYTSKNIIIINNKESAIKLDEEQRLGLSEMKSAILSDSAINSVYCREVSRIGRRYDVLSSIKTFLVSNKIQLVVTEGNRRLLKENGEVSLEGAIMFEIACERAISEMEEKKLRFAEGKRKAVRERKVIGSKILFGYTKDSNGVVIIDEEKAEIVRYVFNAIANDGKSTSTIYKELLERGLVTKTYTFSTGGVNFVRNIIINEAYKGGRSKTNKVYEFHYPPIVDAKLWEKANSEMKERCNKPLYNSKNILYAKGLVKCDCGYTMTGNVDALLNYRCNNGCKRVINLNVIEHIAWSEAKEFKIRQIEAEPEQNKRRYGELIADNQKKIDAIVKQIARLDVSLSKAYNGYVFGGASENDYKNTVAKISKERNALESTKVSLESANTRLSELIRREDELDTGTIFGSLVAITDDEERKKLVQEVIGEIIVSDYNGGMLITIVGKNGEVGFNKYLYMPSTRPKTYWMYEDFFTKELKVYKEITNEIEKRFKRRRY